MHRVGRLNFWKNLAIAGALIRRHLRPRRWKSPHHSAQSYRVRKALLFLHHPLHLPHLALEEAVDADLAGVGVEGDGGEAGERGVYHHAGHRLVGDEVGVVMQQRRRFDGNALIGEDDSGREQHVCTPLGSFQVLFRLPSHSATGIKKPRTSLFRVRGPGKTCNAKQRKLTVENRKHLLLPLGIALKFSRFRTAKIKRKRFCYIFLNWFFFGSNSLYHNDLS